MKLIKNASIFIIITLVLTIGTTIVAALLVYLNMNTWIKYETYLYLYFTVLTVIPASP